jgi:4-hydroxy-tetrahydrodipicolinate reductase
MGRVACSALRHQHSVCYAGGLARTAVPSEDIFDSLASLIAAQHPDVLLDLTTHPSSVSISMDALERGVRPVIGATGWTNGECDALSAAARERHLGAMLVPNFSIGATLMMRFAAEAARFFPSAEIIEMHHDQKKDAPSGTARLTAEKIERTGGPAAVPIHSVRMTGLLAHHEILFGGEGELLTIRHDSLSRTSFVAGMLASVQAVMRVEGLVIGLDAALPPAGDHG